MDISLEEIKDIDLEKIPVDEVFQQLKCTPEGLTSVEEENRLKSFGPNKLEEKKECKFEKLFNLMGNPLSWAMVASAVIWLYSLVTYVPLDILKFGIRYVLRG